MSGLSVPDITPDHDTLGAALAYAASGWYVLPVDRASKHAGSVVGKGWPHKSSRDTETIVGWFTATDYALALHVGRSGAIAFDVDLPGALPDVLTEAIEQGLPPYQSTRVDDPGRGHYLFAVPPERSLGNRQGQLGKAWGEVRGRNGIIVVAPSEHEKAADGGRYVWERIGVLPLLPDSLGDLLPDVTDGEDAATDAEVRAFLERHTASARPELLNGILGQFAAALAEGGSRHMAVLLPAADAMREAAAGLYPAVEAATKIRAAFVEAMSRSRDGGERTLTESAARAEFAGILAWAIAQVADKDVDAVRRRVTEQLRHDDEDLHDLIQPRPPAPVAASGGIEGNLATVQLLHPEADEAPEAATRPQAEISTHPLKYTDDWLAAVLVAQFGDRIRYCPRFGYWLTWDGTRWAEAADVGPVRQYVRTIARSMPEDTKPGLEAKRRAGSRTGIDAAITLAQGDPRVVVTPAQLDAHPWELNTPGGIVDLRTGELGPHDPLKLHTRITGATPDFDADAGVWDRFLHVTFNGDAELIAFMKRLAGYSAVGVVREHIFPFAFGEGGNGKGVFLEAVAKVLGDYAGKTKRGFLAARDRDAHPEEVAVLAGLRMVVCAETNEGDRFDEGKVKELTGGDTLTGRHLYGKSFSFEPQMTLWLMGNHRPKVESGGRSFWRRMREIPFVHKVPDEEAIPDLQAILARDHGGALMAWIVLGAVAYATQGLAEPETVVRATREYEREQNTVKGFVEECCHLGGTPVVQLLAEKLRTAYEGWCRTEGVEPLDPRAFGRRLKAEYRIESKRSNGKRFYLGVALLIDEGDDEGDRDGWR